jgi:hypothetical protein
MATRKILLSLALAVLILPSLSLFAEQRATVLLRNGDRVAGVLEDVENGVVFVRVSQHDQRKLGLGDVALIDLVGGASGLPETELRTARGSNHLTVLRDGSSWTGQFVDIRGGEAGAAPGEALTLIFRLQNGEERRVNLDNVGRVYLGNFPGGTSASTQPADPGQPLPSGAIRIPGNATWVATPLTVRRGDQVQFNVTGRIQLSDDPEDVAHSAGSLRQRRAPGSPLAQNLAGALIAKVGNSAPFPIGDQASVTMPANGQLYLGINDDEVSDNRGEFVVTLTPTTTRRR